MDDSVNVRINPEVLTHFMGRNLDGYRVWFTAGEPDKDGFSLLTIHYDPNDRIGCDDCRKEPSTEAVKP